MLVKHKTPTAEAFHAWMGEYPESFHPSDARRFFTFVKTAITHGAKNWLNSTKLRSRILELQPAFDKETLEDLMGILENIKEYLNAPTIRVHEIDSYLKVDGSKDKFMEVSVKDDGRRSEIMRDMKDW